MCNVMRRIILEHQEYLQAAIVYIHNTHNFQHHLFHFLCQTSHVSADNIVYFSVPCVLGEDIDDLFFVWGLGLHKRP